MLQSLPVRCSRALDGCLIYGKAIVKFLLPALGRDRLLEIAYRVPKSDTDQGHTQVAGLLAMVARQHAKSAGVQRNGLMERKLC